MERLSGVPDRVPLLHNGIANSDSGRLQDVNIQYLEDAPPYQTPPELLRASTSKAAAAGSAQEQSQIQTRKQAAREDSPIRTLSEDRAHVSLRLGPMPPLTGATSPEPTLSKAAGKRVTRAPPNSRVQGSPAKGVPVNKRKVTKAKSSPKRKLGVVSKAKGKGKALAPGARPATTLIPAITKKRVDFQTAPPSLP